MKPTTIDSVVKTIPDSNQANARHDHRVVNLNSSAFANTVKMLCEKYDFDEIIETGTFNGLGSTKVFAETGKYVFSIECNRNNYLQAVKNLENYDNVCVVHGLSLDMEEAVKALLEEDFDLKTNYDSKYPKSFYMREITQMVPLQDALSLFVDNNRRQLVFLDSAGGIGYMEYNRFMDLIAGKPLPGTDKILMLDDINHIKHIRSVDDLERQGFTVNKSADGRFAWCDLSNGALLKKSAKAFKGLMAQSKGKYE